MDKSYEYESYEKAADAEQAEKEFRSKKRRNAIVITMSTVILISVAIFFLIGISTFDNSRSDHKSSSSLLNSSSQVISALCNVTRYQELCYSSMSSALELEATSSNDTNGKEPGLGELFLISLKIALNESSKLSNLPTKIMSSEDYFSEISDTLVQSALNACEKLFMDATDRIKDSISAMEVGQGDNNMVLITSSIIDIRTWLSTAITDHETCIDGVQETGRQSITDEMTEAVAISTKYTSNSLAIFSNVWAIVNDVNIRFHRKLLTSVAGFPRWVERRLLREENLKPNVTVAKDGSGDFKTINEALKLIPRMSSSRFVIYVKEGVYVENVTIDVYGWNVMMYGDGMDKTIVSGSKNMADGVTTYYSATFAAEGQGFIARDMGFVNTAGPEKFQAVALRSSSDRSVFYRCSFEAYQDTLYTHTNRQFYRDCRISGTIDFIFGNAAVVFQNCSIHLKQALKNQFSVITCQGKSDPNQNSGFSLQRCQITPDADLTMPAFLGRPWRDYATTVVMESFMGRFLDPLGWVELNPNGGPPTATFYGEFQNDGPGSAIGGRVRWPGVKPNLTTEEAARFSVEELIQGSQWLPEANVEYDTKL
ncbi:hypothetical protein K2173_016174 [Erythroxylum novogranatense]|uniref:Pectinesterase n=1 Tax=Erythroxylum novogranatense TaxID=1862640 RepID=A0AAV8SG65_9ROSI|nr:hypothetical protein K2173_016174 [Erythroxylum novogranatense]